MILSKGEPFGFAPQALGERIPNIANGYFYSPEGLHLSGTFAAYPLLYKRQSAIATVVDKIANATARLPIKVWDPTTGMEDTSSPYAKLIASPCPTMAPMPFWRWVSSTYEIYGEAFLWKQRRDVDTETGKQSGPVVALLPMHPSRTAVHRDEEGNIEFVFALGVASAGLLRAPSEDVIPFQRYNPDTLMRGLSRLEPLNATLLNEDAARRANASWWQRGARPSVVLQHPGELSQDAQDRIKASFDARHAGADLMGGTSVLEEGMTANIIQLNAEEMQYIESRKLNREEVCMVYDVPPPVVHILDHATFSNITEQMRSMYRDTMTPRLEDIESVLDHHLMAADFFGQGERDTKFDMSEVLRGDFETRADKGALLRQNGGITGNEMRELIGLGRVDDPEMDKFYANAALVPLGTPAQRVSITEAVAPDPAQAGEITDTAQGAQEAASDAANAQKPKGVTVRAVLGKTGRVKDSKSAIRETLVAEHTQALGKFFDRQRAAVKAAAATKAAGVFDPSQWDGDLSGILHTLSQATALAIGNKVAADLGGKYSGKDIAAWLMSNSEATAKKINQATADEITAALENAGDDESSDDTIDGLFDGTIAARHNQISLTRVLVVGSLAALVAARLSSAKTKTWVTGGNPRADHAEMDGETVPLGELFSNGMNGPGDYSGGADEVAGCNCDLDFSTEG
jgi:HK97 family phage portal protein